MPFFANFAKLIKKSLVSHKGKRQQKTGKQQEKGEITNGIIIKFIESA